MSYIYIYEGKSENIRTFDSFSKTIQHLKRNLSTLFQNILHLRLRTFAIFVGAFVFSRGLGYKEGETTIAICKSW
jgi:hypothetical protein